jgi:hypothetical protein
MRRSTIDNPELADLLLKSVDFESLSPAERFRVSLACANVVEHLQRAFLLRNEGLVHWQTQEAQLRTYLGIQPFKQWWASGREILQPEFVEFVERHILPAAASASPPHWVRWADRSPPTRPPPVNG